MKRIKFRYVIMIEAIILLMLGISLLKQLRTDYGFMIPLESWSSQYVSYDKEACTWQVNEEDGIDKQDGDVCVLNSPKTEIKKGTYTFFLEYKCDVNQSFLIYAEGNNAKYVQAQAAEIDKDKNKLIYHFEIEEDIDDLQVGIYYTGTGCLAVWNVEIAHNLNSWYKTCFLTMVLLVLFNLCILKWDVICRHKHTIAAIVGITFLVSLPVFITGIGRGHDLAFHLMRIEGIAQEIRFGNFPVRVSSMWMDETGYPVSIYYGDILLYFPALLRIIGFSIEICYKSFIVFVNLGTTIVSFFCFRKIFQDRSIALLCTLAYCTASYRMVNIFVRAAVGEYSAMMFFPIVAMAVYSIYTENSSEWKRYRRNALFLAIGMTGIVGTHILSTEIIVIILTLICILLWKRTFCKNTIKVFLLAIFETLCMSAYFIFPFLDYYFNVSANINVVVDKEQISVLGNGAYFSDYFAFFQDMYTTGTVHENPSMLLTPGLVLMAAFCIAIVFWINGKASKRMKWLVCISFSLLFMASNLFPWNYLASHYKIGKILVQIQFPWRYLSAAVIVMTVLLGGILQSYKEQAVEIMQYVKAITAISVIMTCYLVGNYSDDAKILRYYDTIELDEYAVGNGEYLLTGANRYNLYTDVFWEKMESVEIKERKGTYMQIYCKGIAEEGKVSVPFFQYKGYHVIDEYGTEYEILDDVTKYITFNLPAGYEGNVTIDFVEPWYWRAAEVISVVSLIVLLYGSYILCHTQKEK